MYKAGAELLEELTSGVNLLFTLWPFTQHTCFHLVSFPFIYSFPLVPPKIGNSPTLINARVGQDVVLPCEAIGIPVPRVMWTKGGEKYPGNNTRFQQMSQGSLTIQNVKEDDSGKYLCIAASDAGSDSRFVTLEVNGECLSTS